MRKDAATLVVTDEGHGADDPEIDPTSAPPSPTSPRGRGFPIMQSLADELTVERVGNGTQVTMQFAVQADDPEAISSAA